jgi:hypothetical protein
LGRHRRDAFAGWLSTVVKGSRSHAVQPVIAPEPRLPAWLGDLIPNASTPPTALA